MDFNSFPVELRLTPLELSQFTTDDILRIFKIAQNYGLLDEFSDYFWSTMSQVRPNTTDYVNQRALLYLESYKRNIGRTYSRTGNPEVAYQYNCIELFIQEFANKYNLTRKSVPHLLNVSSEKSTRTRCEERPAYTVPSKFKKCGQNKDFLIGKS